MLKSIAFFLTYLERKKPYELMGRVNTINSFMVSSTEILRKNKHRRTKFSSPLEISSLLSDEV